MRVSDQLPKGWQFRRFAELAEFKQSLFKVEPTETYREITLRLYGNGVELRREVVGSQLLFDEMQLLQAGDLITSIHQFRNGALAIVDEEFAGAVASKNFLVFDLNTSVVEPSYLELFLTSPASIAFFQANSTGSATPIFPKKLIAEVEIPLPPVTEQRRIVARIEQLAAQIEEARRLRHQVTEEIQALLASASDVAFKPQKGWKEARVADFCETPQYGYTESATSEPVGPRFLRITDIQDGRVNWDTVPFCQCPNPEQYLLKANDIVFARTGATTGKSFLIRECPEAVFASYLIRLRVQQLVTPDYLYRYFQTPSYWAQITDEKKGTGQPNVNGKKLANIRVPVPPPEEQQRIVGYLDGLAGQVAALARLQSETAAELDALLPSILDRAFKGELC